MSRAALVAALAAAVLAAPADGRDHGQQGAVFPVIEADLLTVIQRRLTTMQASGEIDRMNRALAARTAARVRRPAPVEGIGTALAPRRWAYDPTIRVDEDLRDAKGRVVVRAGTRVNPLDTVTLRSPLVFIDGDAPAQVAWATRPGRARDAKLILVRGSPFALMKAQQRRVYFDQGGALTTKLGIRAVPALVEQRGRVLAVSEIPVPSTGASR